MDRIGRIKGKTREWVGIITKVLPGPSIMSILSIAVAFPPFPCPVIEEITR
jgi:hypothetical protein